MFCPKCGSELKGESSCCENCGWSYENTITIQCKDIEEENTVNKEKVHESGTMLKDEYVVQKKEEEKIVEKSKISKKFWIVTISIIVIIAIASVYCETDAYKFGKAQKAILKGDWQEAEEALSIIESYKTPKAISMRKYAEFLYSRDCFIESYAEYTGFTKADSYLAQHLDEFRTAIENLKNEEEYNYLPEKLKKQYYYYSEKMDSIDKQYEDAYSHFYDAQIVFLNDVIRNREEDYTLEEMQKIMEI